MIEPPDGRTLVIIPALNEEESLPGVLRELASEAPWCNVLVVDDGSVDGTADAARRAGVLVARLPFNIGVGGALRTGFRYAIAQGYDRAIQLDADGQHDPSQIGRLMSALECGADLVLGSRFATHSSSYRVGRLRGGGMRVLRLAVQLLSGHAFSDTSSGFRAFSRPMLEFFARTYPVEYMDSVEALLLACYAGYRVVETPVAMRERSGGQPSNRNLHLIYHYVRLLIVMLTKASMRNRSLYRTVA